MNIHRKCASDASGSSKAGWDFPHGRASAFLERAIAWLDRHGVAVQRVNNLLGNDS
jgi:hypothetical protein